LFGRVGYPILKQLVQSSWPECVHTASE
jgi:hypothetical protein